jgi:hypothetical protein
MTTLFPEPLLRKTNPASHINFGDPAAPAEADPIGAPANELVQSRVSSHLVG